MAVCSSLRPALFWAAALTLLLVSFAYGLDDASLSQTAHSKVDAGDPPGATELFSQLLQQYPDSTKAPDAQLSLAKIKYKLNPQATQELLDAFSLVRTKYPASAEAAEALARMGFLHTKSSTAQAINDFTTFLTGNPDHPLAASVQQSLGRLYLKTKEFDKAEAAFDAVKTFATAPAGVADEAALQSGFVKIMKFYASKDKSYLQAAMEALSKFGSSSRVKVRARADLGVAECLLLLGKAEQARAKYEAASQTYSTEPYFQGLALYGVACSSQQAGNLDSAISDYDAFLGAQAGANLKDKDTAWKASCLASTSASAQASVQADGSWGRIPASGIVTKAACQRGDCLYSLGRYKDAEQQFKEVADAFPDDPIGNQAKEGLARCRMAKGGK